MCADDTSFSCSVASPVLRADKCSDDRLHIDSSHRIEQLRIYLSETSKPVHEGHIH